MMAATSGSPLASLPTAHRAALTVLALSVVAIAGAWYTQLVWGLDPCELCLLERWPYYIGVPVAALAVVALWIGSARVGRALLWLVALIFLVSLGLGVFHAGVEWGFWPGPAACTGHYDAGASNDDFLKSLEGAQVVRCDAAAIRIAGLSLAGWNAVASLAVAVIAAIGASARRD